MLKKILTHLLIVAILAMSAAFFPSVGAVAQTYDDEFNTGTLDAKWSWVRQNAANWSLTASPGNMRIIAEAGDLNHSPASNRNLLLQNAPAGNWRLDTKLTGKPHANWLQAGLIVYQDDNNYIRMNMLYNNANQFQCATEV